MKYCSVLIAAGGLVSAVLTGCHKSNHAPGTAVVPRGERFVFVGSPTAMYSNVEDIDDDSVSIRFAWGDGDTSGWSPYFPERGSMSMTHTWASAGTYVVAAQARDILGATSAWSDGRAIQVIRGWAKTFGGDLTDVGSSVQQTPDGGYVVVGTSTSQAAGIWLMKTDANGNEIWARGYGGTVVDIGNSVCQTADGGLILAGTIGSNYPPERQILLLKLNAEGETTWTRVYDGMSEDGVNSVQQTADGGYIAVASTSSRGAGGDDIWLLRMNDSGDTVWTLTYGWASVDEGRFVQQTNDGGYIVVGNTRSVNTGSTGIWLLKTDASGDTVWSRVFDGGSTDRGHAVQQTKDGGYIVTGQTTTYSGWHVWLIKTDANGDTTWTRTFGRSGDAEGHSVQQTLDGGYVVTGYDGSDVCLVKTDAGGNEVWSKTFGWDGIDMGNSVQQTQDGGYMIAGSTSSYGSGMEDVWLIRVESDGDVSGPSSMASEK